ncbi:hypothetical protein [Neptuniibacter sp. QD48_11]|uniref:hypothetical protein n=1 Tax=Neptuniibacter sp. QD48_11 TaxID=3398211 RepID=UPI0039F5E951
MKCSKKKLERLAVLEYEFVVSLAAALNKSSHSCLVREYLRLFGWEFEAYIAEGQYCSGTVAVVNNSGYGNKKGKMRKVKVSKFADRAMRGKFITV